MSNMYVESIDEVIAAAREAQEALRQTVALMQQVRQMHEQGMSIVEVTREYHDRGWREQRLATGRSLAAYESSMLGLRSQIVRDLVDNYGMTLTAVAKVMGVSRTMAARLYRVRKAS